MESLSVNINSKCSVLNVCSKLLGLFIFLDKSGTWNYLHLVLFPVTGDESLWGLCRKHFSVQFRIFQAAGLGIWRLPGGQADVSAQVCCLFPTAISLVKCFQNDGSPQHSLPTVAEVSREVSDPMLSPESGLRCLNPSGHCQDFPNHHPPLCHQTTFVE